MQTMSLKRNLRAIKAVESSDDLHFSMHSPVLRSIA